MELVSSCMFWMNVYLRESGMSNTTSLINIIIFLTIECNKQYNLHFVEYFQTNNHNDEITGIARMFVALYLCTKVNEQQGYYFYILKTGWTINCNLSVPLPISDNVINLIYDLDQNEPMVIT